MRNLVRKHLPPLDSLHHGKTYNPILVVNGIPMTAEYCPPCYDPFAYGWAAAIPVNEVSDVKFYEAESKYSQWLTPPPPPQIMDKRSVIDHRQSDRLRFTYL